MLSEPVIECAQREVWRRRIGEKRDTKENIGSSVCGPRNGNRFSRPRIVRLAFEHRYTYELRETLDLSYRCWRGHGRGRPPLAFIPLAKRVFPLTRCFHFPANLVYFSPTSGSLCRGCLRERAEVKEYVCRTR